MSNKDTSDRTDVSKFKAEADGSFKRFTSTFRDMIETGGRFEPEKDRYHLYVSLACPWAHRTLILVQLKGLQDIISTTTVSPRMGANGWPFANADFFPGAQADDLNHADHIKDVYFKADPDYSGRFTVPVLWDKKLSTIVNNESSEIIRILNSAFNSLLPAEKAQLDLYPPNLRAEIDDVNAWVYDTVNNGVYKTGIARSQEAYIAAFDALFASLDRLEKMLEGKEYLVGSQLTEADVRLFVTIIRFDPVYHGLFKCNLRTIRDGYPAIDKWLRKMYWSNDAFKSTTDFDHIKTHYYWSLIIINPTRVIPLGPQPHILLL